MSITIYNDTYSLLTIVKQVHHIPHLNSYLQHENNNWDITVDSQWNSYTKSVLTLPIIICLIGLLLVIIYLIVFCCCGRSKQRNDEYQSLLRHSHHTPNKKVIAMLILSLVSVILIDQMVFYGNNVLSNGINKGNDNLNDLDNIFVDLNNYGNDLTDESSDLQYDLTQSCSSSCNQPCLLESKVVDLNTYIDNYLSYIEDVPNQCDTVEDNLDLFGTYYKNIIIWIVYVLIMVCVLLHAFGMYKSKIYIVRCGSCLSNTIMISLILICTILMILLMLTADFCMSPTENLLQIVPSGDIYDTIYYYTTCSGTNPLSTEIDEAQSLVDELEISLNAIKLIPDCSDKITSLNKCLSDTTRMDSTLNQIESSIQCPSIQSYYQNILNDSICTDVFTGVYIIWLGFYFSVLFIYISSWYVWYLYPTNQLQNDGNDGRIPLITAEHNGNIYSPIATNNNEGSYSNASAPIFHTDDHEEESDEIIYAIANTTAIIASDNSNLLYNNDENTTMNPVIIQDTIAEPINP